MTRAILIMLVAMSLIPAGDTAGKLLSTVHETTPVFVAWSRFVIGALLVLPFTPRSAWALFLDLRIWLRAALLACGIFSIQNALQSAPLADVFAAGFSGPIVSYILAAIFLREPVTLFRTVLIGLGFAGVLLVVRPGADLEIGLVWAVIAGTCFGAFLTMSRWLGHLARPISLVFTQLAIASVLLAPFGIMSLPAYTAPIAGLTFVSAFCSMMGNLLLLFAYRLAPATKLAPLVYLQLIAAVGFGWAVFSQLPDFWTWAGLVLILSAGLVSARLR